MKTSISLDDSTLKIIDDYRRKQPKIPSVSEAIRDLLTCSVTIQSKAVKEENTEIPKTVRFEGKAISIEKSRGRALIKLNPEDLKTLQNSGWIEGSKVDLGIYLE